MSSGQFDLTQPRDRVPLDISQLGAPHDTVVMDFLADANITVENNIASVDGRTLCFNTSVAVRDAVASILPIGPICGQCGKSR